MRFGFFDGLETAIDRAGMASADRWTSRMLRVPFCLLLVVVVVACSQPPADLSEAVEAGDTSGARALLEGGLTPIGQW